MRGFAWNKTLQNQIVFATNGIYSAHMLYKYVFIYSQNYFIHHISRAHSFSLRFPLGLVFPARNYLWQQRNFYFFLFLAARHTFARNSTENINPHSFSNIKFMRFSICCIPFACWITIISMSVGPSSFWTENIVWPGRCFKWNTSKQTTFKVKFLRNRKTVTPAPKRVSLSFRIFYIVCSEDFIKIEKKTWKDALLLDSSRFNWLSMSMCAIRMKAHVWP